MFKSTEAHPHYLSPSDYSDPSVFQRELRGIFERSWVVAGAARDLSRHGDQIALMAGTIPVLVRNEHGTLHAYRNVCPHRHSMLAPLGHTCSPKFRCQYHGWEYAADGRLKHLPDGRSFKGWKAKGANLSPVRLQTAFGLVFVNLAPGETDLATEWGPVFTELEERFRGFELNWIQITEHKNNWKIIVENAVESYHVPMVHPETFGNYREEEHHGHVVEPTFTQYHDLPSLQSPPRLWTILDKLLFDGHKLYGYSHTHVFPNHLISWAGLYREWVVAEPLDPTRVRRVAYGFMPAKMRGAIPRPLAFVLQRELARRTRRDADKILSEDSGLWASVQAGLNASTFPGVISAREERLAKFQQWVLANRATE